MNTNMNSGMLIGGFKAIGKSTLARKYSNVVDIESSNFEYVIDENMRNIPVEQRKGLKSRIKNPEFPLNYCERVIWLKKGEYLEDILLKEGILDIDRRIEEDER